MAYHTTIFSNALDQGFILSPERYDPRRLSSQKGTIRVRDVASISSKHVAPQPDQDCIILDTTHAVEGFVRINPRNTSNPSIKSNKKEVIARDVIISRLRPYLRQVAFIPESLQGQLPRKSIMCSTEFYVLRSIDSASIAFLVPFLLSPAPQQVFAASQEGGHHPRFNSETLLDLPIPDGLINSRERISLMVENQAELLRSLDFEFAQMLEEVEKG